MLAAAQRLRRREDFAATVRGGRRGSRGSVVVHLVVPSAARDTTPPAVADPQVTHEEPARAAQSARAGFVVSKAIGGAIERNLVKRRLRHLMRERIADLPVGSSLVVRALPGAALRQYSELGQDLDAALAVARGPRAPRDAERAAGPRGSQAHPRHRGAARR